MECRVAWSEDRWNGAGERGTESEQWAVCRGGRCWIAGPPGCWIACCWGCRLLGCRTAGQMPSLSFGRSIALVKEFAARAAGNRENRGSLLSGPDGGGAGCGRRVSFLQPKTTLQPECCSVVFGVRRVWRRSFSPYEGGCRRFGSRLSRRIPGRQILSSSTVKCRRIGASNVMR